MDPRQKKHNTVNRCPEQGIQTIHKTMHGLRIDPVGEYPALNQSVHPEMMGIHIATSIREILKCAVRKVGHCKHKNARQHQILSPAGAKPFPKTTRLFLDPALYRVMQKKFDSKVPFKQMSYLFCLLGIRFSDQRKEQNPIKNKVEYPSV